jgi:hypothetical protein
MAIASFGVAIFVSAIFESPESVRRLGDKAPKGIHDDSQERTGPWESAALRCRNMERKGLPPEASAPTSQTVHKPQRVALLARDVEPILFRQSLPGEVSDKHAGHVEAAIHGLIVTSIYAPNGDLWPGSSAMESSKHSGGSAI